MYEYKVIDGHIISKKGKQFSEVFEHLLNEMSIGGWEFYSQSDITQYIPGGCLFGSPEIRVRQTFIFRREVVDTDKFKEEVNSFNDKKGIDILAEDFKRKKEKDNLDVIK